MSPNKTVKPSKASIDELCTITGVDRIVASNLLEACENNLEMAVNMHMEGLGSDPPDGAANNISSPMMEDNVRAPIPQRQEILVEGPDELAYNFRGRRRIARSVFDKFRDFQAETKRQEELLASGDCPAGSSNWKSNVDTKRKKMRTLEDLFRPPIDLMYRGTFQGARDAGNSSKKWLMVNIQDSSEFPCQVLNRDVWSNAAVKTIVQEHFVFWQVYHDSEEGQRYMMFYKISEWPYVAILDPRTGECLVTWHKLDAMTFCDLVTEFLLLHPNLDDSLGAGATADTSSSSSSPKSPPTKKTKSFPNKSDVGNNIIEADEAAQLEAAIKASLESRPEIPTASKGVNSLETKNEEEDNESDTLETFDSDPDDIDYSLNDKKSNNKNSESSSSSRYINRTIIKAIESTSSDISEQTNDRESVDCDKSKKTDNQDWRCYLGLVTDPESQLMLRLPDGSREMVAMPCTSQLMALIKYVGSKGYSNESYELITNFPRRQISYLDFGITLKDAGLYPRETVFIQAR